MSNAVLVAFHRPYPRFNDHYKTQGDLFFKYAKKWIKFVDTFYAIDGGWGVPEHPKVRKIFADNMLHWHYFNLAVPKIAEDKVLLLDPDTLVYDPAVVKEGFERLDEYDCSAILDNSGQAHLEDKYPILQPNENRGVRQRIVPYLCFIKTELLKDRDFSTVPDKFDSMGKITDELLAQDIKLHELPDDRSTLRLLEGKNLTRDTWLDGPGYKWSEPVDGLVSRGYYHVRNSTLGLSLLTEWQYDRQAYDLRKAITPIEEALRLLAWQAIYDMEAGVYEGFEGVYVEVLTNLGVGISAWDQYLREFGKYHTWLKETPKAVKP